MIAGCLYVLYRFDVCHILLYIRASIVNQSVRVSFPKINKFSHPIPLNFRSLEATSHTGVPNPTKVTADCYRKRKQPVETNGQRLGSIQNNVPLNFESQRPTSPKSRRMITRNVNSPREHVVGLEDEKLYAKSRGFAGKRRE